MKILHTAALLRPPLGVVNQMAWEQSAARALRADWEVKIFCPAGLEGGKGVFRHSALVRTRRGATPLRKAFDWFLLRWEYHRWLKEMEASVDAFVLRHYVHDPFQLWFIANCSKPVYVVHHTLEVPELRSSEGLRGRLRAALESLFGRYSIRRCAATIGVTAEIIEYEKSRAGVPAKRAWLYPNGILLTGQTPTDRRSNVPELLFVAGAFAHWQGLDRLLDAAERCQHAFILHLVGELSDSDRKRALADPRIILHGCKTHEDIAQIAASCWVGLSSFALDRKAMQQACTLKVREYLMMGLPVCAGYDEVFPDGFAFYRKLGPDMVAILDFARETRGLTRQAVIAGSREHIDKIELLDGLLAQIAGEPRRAGAREGARQQKPDHASVEPSQP